MKGLFWGLLTVDLHFFTDHFPDENTKTKVKKFNTYIGGPATNAAIAFQHLGGNAQLVTAIGQNNYHGLITEDLARFKIAFNDMKATVPSDPVFASILTNDTNGSRTIFSYFPSSKDLSNHVKSDHVDIALFDGFYMDSAIEKAKECRNLGITTVLDGGSWKNDMHKLLKHIDIAICSEDFVPPRTVTSDDIIAYMMKRGVKNVAITRGSKPIIVSEGEVNEIVKVPTVDAVDTLGAGDIFHGAFCYYFAAGDKFKLALKKAAQIAAKSCQHAGPHSWMERG